MERKIGEVFECNGKKYITKAHTGCSICAFHNPKGCILTNIIRVNCAGVTRSDRTDVIFVEYKEEKVMENLLNCKGKRFKCKISGIFVEGRIQIEADRVFLCQGVKDGGRPKDTLGYPYAWYVETGSEYHLLSNNVTNFRLIDMTKEDIENYKDWQVGDKIIDKLGNKGEIIFRSGELVVFKFDDNNASSNYTVNGLHNKGWRLDETPIEESFVEMTMEEIAELKGIPVEKLRIKDK